MINRNAMLTLIEDDLRHGRKPDKINLLYGLSPMKGYHIVKQIKVLKKIVKTNTIFIEKQSKGKRVYV